MTGPLKVEEKGGVEEAQARNSLGPEGAKRFLARTPNAAGKKTTSCRVGQEAAPDTDFCASTGVGKIPSQTGLTERAPQISFPETALGRKEPRVRQPCSVASVDDRVSNDLCGSILRRGHANHL